MHAVGIGVFSVLQTVYKLMLIAVFLAGHVRLLYGAARRSIVALGSEAYHRAIGERERPLHESFSERAAPHHHSAVIILHGSRENLACRSRELVHHHHHASTVHGAVGNGAVIERLHAHTFGEHNRVASVEKQSGKVVGGLEVTAAIVLEVHNHVAHAFACKFGQCLAHLIESALAEPRHTYITHSGSGHERGVDTRYGNIIAHYAEFYGSFRTLTEHIDIHHRPLGTAQYLLDVGILFLHARYDGIVGRKYAVSGQKAHFLRGAARNGLNHIKRIVEHVKLNADT